MIKQCEQDAHEADRLADADQRARACQRDLDATDGARQQGDRERERMRTLFAGDLATCATARGRLGAELERERKAHISPWIWAGAGAAAASAVWIVLLVTMGD